MRIFRHIAITLAVAAGGLAAGSAFAAAVGTAVVVTIAPNAPSNLTAAAAAPQQITLTWTNNAAVDDGFSVERATSSGSFAVIGTTGSNIARYVDNSVSAGTTYLYRVRAFLGAAYSGYSNEASATTPTVPPAPNSGGGGGGGGGGGPGGEYFYAPPATQTNVTISGLAYPGSQVFILKDGQQALQTVAGPDGRFTGTIGGLNGGSYVFIVYAEDAVGHRSNLFDFPVSIQPGDTTMVSGVFLSPTIQVNFQEVKRGSPLLVSGTAAPGSTVAIEIHSAQAFFYNAVADASGTYSATVDTAALSYGQHLAVAQASAGSQTSPQSQDQTFTVGAENVPEPQTAICPPNYSPGDLNQDCRVNLVDFSILAYWYGRTGFPSAYDLNGDGSIDLADFSIMAYYWTG